MSIATEQETHELKRSYHIKVYDLPCFHNALNAWLSVVNVDLNERNYYPLPEIWSMRFSESMQLPDTYHVYFVYRGVVYNHSVTWPNNSFPNFDYPILHRNGQNVTDKILVWALSTTQGGEDMKDMNIPISLFLENHHATNEQVEELLCLGVCITRGIDPTDI